MLDAKQFPRDQQADGIEFFVFLAISCDAELYAVEAISKFNKSPNEESISKELIQTQFARSTAKAIWNHFMEENKDVVSRNLFGLMCSTTQCSMCKALFIFLVHP